MCAQRGMRCQADGGLQLQVHMHGTFSFRSSLASMSAAVMELPSLARGACEQHGSTAGRDTLLHQILGMFGGQLNAKKKVLGNGARRCRRWMRQGAATYRRCNPAPFLDHAFAKFELPRKNTHTHTIGV